MNINEIYKIIDNELTGRHSFFQLEYFMLKSEPSHQAQLHQCLVEIQSRRKTLDHVDTEIEEVIDRMELLKLEEITYKLEKEKEIKERIINRKLLSMQNRIKELSDIAKHTEEELSFIFSIFQNLSDKEPLKPWDSSEVQLEYWSNKCLRDIRAKTLLGYPLDPELIKTTFALPDNSFAKQEMIKNIERTVETNSKRLNNSNNDKT